MKSSLKILGLSALLAVGWISNASAVTLLGYYVYNENPDNANLTTETGIFNHLLDMALNTTDPTPIPGPPTSYYSRLNIADPGTGDVADGVKGAAANPNTTPPTPAATFISGFEYAMGRYDGPNGGYVMYYLGGVNFDMPASSSGLWGQSYNLSHFTAFNPGTPGDPPGVPDGGSTIALLGAALMLIAGVSRRGLSFAEI